MYNPNGNHHNEKWLVAMRSPEHRKIQRENAIRLKLKPPSAIGNKVNLGRKHSEETKRKMSKTHKGKRPYQMTEEIKKKISIAKKGFKHSEETKRLMKIACMGRGFQKGHIPWCKGRKVPLKEETKRKLSIAGKNRFVSEETRKKLSEMRKGDKHHNWQGGISFEPYPLGWTNTHKEQIRQRDEYKCQLCGAPEVECIRKLHVHHKDYIKKNISDVNLISLCNKCHTKTNYNREYWLNYFGVKVNV